MKIAHVQNSDRSARDPIPPELSTVFHSPNNELLHVFKDHSLISLAQALDRLAAVTVAVGGFKEKLLHTDCGRILDIAAKAHKTGNPATHFAQEFLPTSELPGDKNKTTS